MFGDRFPEQCEMPGSSSWWQNKIVAANSTMEGMLLAFKLNTELLTRECHRDFLVTAKLWASGSGVWVDGSGG
jgi:hypothetical protein